MTINNGGIIVINLLEFYPSPTYNPTDLVVFHRNLELSDQILWQAYINIIETYYVPGTNLKSNKFWLNVFYGLQHA